MDFFKNSQTQHFISEVYTEKIISNPCYQLGFCTELISTGATHAIQLGFAPIVYPLGQYK
jgi:hypothetical protein